MPLQTGHFQGSRGRKSGRSRAQPGSTSQSSSQVSVQRQSMRRGAGTFPGDWQMGSRAIDSAARAARAHSPAEAPRLGLRRSTCVCTTCRQARSPCNEPVTARREASKRRIDSDTAGCSRGELVLAQEVSKQRTSRTHAASPTAASNPGGRRTPANCKMWLRDVFVDSGLIGGSIRSHGLWAARSPSGEAEDRKDAPNQVNGAEPALEEEWVGGRPWSERV